MTDSELISRKESYVTFLMNKERYAVSVFKVTELLEMLPITHVPRVPDFMRGVVNLRGEVIPIIDSRIKFLLIEAPDTVDTCIIVMHVQIEGKAVRVGIVVDSVSDVIEIDKQEILPLPSFGNQKRSNSITGVIRMNDQIIMLLDVDKEFKKDLIEFEQLELAECVA